MREDVAPPASCPHQPTCPPAEAADHAAATCVASHPGQGWWLLCNGVVCFDDTGELLPDGTAIPPCRVSGNRRTDGEG
ncbi:DUF5999 family protein [Catenulispora sp. GAS73]|uniref:DUF5999 family protein n=1 Tax=Catenulispora sp. GAS73 TaxID=3156269 RepID=UPI003513FB92